MWKRIAALFLVVVSLAIAGCAGPTGGLQSYADGYDGYEFLYPNSWVAVDTKNLVPDVIFRDLIERSENVSIVISPVPEGKTIADLGTPTEVGYRLSKQTEGDRVAELLDAHTREADGKTYYIFEYAVELPSGDRHNIASAIVRRDKLFTLNVSTSETRWQKVGDRFRTVINSFNVY